jgi:hypothetical protein
MDCIRQRRNVDSLRQLKSQWDRIGAVLCNVAGAVLLIAGYFGVSNQGLPAEQIPYIISGGLGGIFLMGIGAALWLSADLRDEWKKLDRIESVLEQGLDELGLGRGPNNRPTVVPLDRSSTSQAASQLHSEFSDSPESVGSMTIRRQIEVLNEAETNS